MNNNKDSNCNDKNLDVIKDVRERLTAKDMVEFLKQNNNEKKDEIVKESGNNTKILLKIEENREKIEANINKLSEKIKAKDNLSGRVKIYEIIKCFLSSYFQNLCVYSNNDDIGYTLIHEMINVNLVKSTSLVLNQNLPKWIFCLEITKSDTTTS